MGAQIGLGLASCAFWAAAGAALAQPTADVSRPKLDVPTVGEVVVIGHAPKRPQALAKTVRNFVHDLGRPGPVGQVSRWGEPVCPTVEGLSPAFDDFVAKRIGAIAARVGAPAGGDCRTRRNALVVFTTKPDRLMRDIRRHHEGLLGFHYNGETTSLAAFQPPMKSWYVTMTIGPGWRNIDSAYGRLLPNQGASHFPPPMKSEFAFALVVVDSSLLEGQAIGPVADRIAMLVLSRPAPRKGCSPLPSVLDLLDPECPSGVSRDGLTLYDEAYLKALYAYKGSEIRYFERRSMAKRIVADTEAASPGAR